MAANSPADAASQYPTNPRSSSRIVRRLDEGAASLPAVTPRLYSSDEVQYFSYLRSLWFDHDVSFENEYRHFYDRGIAKSAGFHETFLERQTNTGRRINFNILSMPRNGADQDPSGPGEPSSGAGTPVALNPREHTAYQWLPWRQAADTCSSSSPSVPRR